MAHGAGAWHRQIDQVGGRDLVGARAVTEDAVTERVHAHQLRVAELLGHALRERPKSGICRSHLSAMTGTSDGRLLNGLSAQFTAVSPKNDGTYSAVAIVLVSVASSTTKRPAA